MNISFTFICGLVNGEVYSYDSCPPLLRQEPLPSKTGHHREDFWDWGKSSSDGRGNIYCNNSEFIQYWYIVFTVSCTCTMSIKWVVSLLMASKIIKSIGIALSSGRCPLAVANLRHLLSSLAVSVSVLSCEWPVESSCSTIRCETIKYHDFCRL